MNYTTQQLLALYCAGGQPQQAHTLDSTLSIGMYYVLVQSDEYKYFYTKQNKYFFDSAEGALLHRLNKVVEVLTDMELTKDYKAYAQTTKAYTDLLKLTAPIIARLAQIQAEASHFDGFEIRIKGVDDE